MNRPPFTSSWWVLASFIAESTAMGMDSFSAQEKSTISTASALFTFRVSSQIRAVAPRL